MTAILEVPPGAPVVTALAVQGQLAGRWRRSLIGWPDGSRELATDTTTVVDWLQAHTCYVDVRQSPTRPDFRGTRCLDEVTAEQLAWLVTQEAFAGVTRPGADGGGDFLEWIRTVDYTPAGTPDAGRLYYAGEGAEAIGGAAGDGMLEAMVEVGLDGSYVEHWHRDSGPTAPCFGLLLQEIGSRAPAVLLRVGNLFGFARGRANPLPAGRRLGELVTESDLMRGRTLVDCEVAIGGITGERWSIARSTLPFREGHDLGAAPDGELWRTRDVAADGTEIERRWTVRFAEGER